MRGVDVAFVVTTHNNSSVLAANPKYPENPILSLVRNEVYLPDRFLLRLTFQILKSYPFQMVCHLAGVLQQSVQSKPSIFRKLLQIPVLYRVGVPFAVIIKMPYLSRISRHLERYHIFMILLEITLDLSYRLYMIHPRPNES